ncbi:transposase [Methanospirillum stamsii]|uniref:transposase n=1 Tax=Methanospirillum stamsii TaxID=1277351 RepID=UPI003183E783
MPHHHNMIKGYGNEQQFLLPVNAMEWLSENDITYAILDILSLLDISKFIDKYREDGRGSAFFDPRVMLGILIYAMIRGEKSSRKIEMCCHYDIGYRIVAHNLTPDHTTIYRFKKNNSYEIKSLFKQLSRIIVESGIAQIGVLALDGSKFGCNASLSANKKLKHLESELNRLFDESQEIDESENKDGNAQDMRINRLPEHLSTNEKRKKVLIRARDKIIERNKEESKKQEEKIKEREKEERESGKLKRGRKPSKPQKNPSPDLKVNVTDPDSQIMSTTNGWIQGYNGQIIVSENQYILAALLSDEQNDKKLLVPMLNELQELFSGIHPPILPHSFLSDAGYYSYQNALAENEYSMNFIIPPSKERKIHEYTLDDGNVSRMEEICKMISNGIRVTIAELANIGTFVWRSFMDREKNATNEEICRRIMEARVRSPTGRELYRKRKYMVEPVFGDIKHNMRFRTFSQKGKENCEGEFFLAALVHNIKKLAKISNITTVGHFFSRFLIHPQSQFPLFYQPRTVSAMRGLRSVNEILIMLAISYTKV